MNAWKRSLAWLDAKTPRERLIMFLMALAVVWLAADLALLTPQDRSRRAAEAKIKEMQQRAVAAELALGQLVGQADPGKEARLRLEAARQAYQARVDAFTDLAGRLISPQDMPRVLENLSWRQAGLRLVGLKTLSAEPIGLAPGVDARDAATPAGLYRHGVELTLEGGYAELTAYLDRVERLPFGVYWGGAELDAREHPRLVLRLTVYTLSQDRTWLTL